MYTCQQRWHLTLSSSNHEQSGGCQECTINTTKCGAGYKQGHDPGHLAIQPDDNNFEPELTQDDKMMMYLSEKVTATASDPSTSDTDKVV